MKQIGPTNTDALKALISTFVSSVLPAMAAAHPSANFNWRGNTQAFAKEYAQVLVGTGCTGKHIREAVEAMRVRSGYERNPPNAQEFKILCLQSKGMPTLESCIAEIDRERIEHFGHDKQWSCSFVYWLNAATAAARRQLSHDKYMQLARRHYAELAERYARNELADIPLQIEHKAEPAYLRYLNEGAA